MIYLWVRKTLDWQNAALVEAQIRPSFRPKMEMWNATFEMPYYAFRHELKSIAQRNLARVVAAEIAPYEEVPVGELLVPVDDDDWFAPDLAAHLAGAVPAGSVGVSWIRNILEAQAPKKTLKGWLRARRRRLLGPAANQGRYTCGTNNYALVHSPELVKIASNHETASRFFDANPARVRRLPETLSLQNRNLASQTALAFRNSELSRAELLATFRRYRAAYSRVRLAEGMSWAAPCIEEVAELTRNLTLRR